MMFKHVNSSMVMRKHYESDEQDKTEILLKIPKKKKKLQNVIVNTKNMKQRWKKNAAAYKQALCISNALKSTIRCIM